MALQPHCNCHFICVGWELQLNSIKTAKQKIIVKFEICVEIVGNLRIVNVDGRNFKANWAIILFKLYPKRVGSRVIYRHPLSRNRVIESRSTAGRNAADFDLSSICDFVQLNSFGPACNLKM